MLGSLASTQVCAFAPQTGPRIASSLNAKQHNEPTNWGNAVTSALVGLTFAAQASFAAVDVPINGHISDGTWLLYIVS